MAISVDHGGINLKVKYILTKRMEKKTFTRTQMKFPKSLDIANWLVNLNYFASRIFRRSKIIKI